MSLSELELGRDNAFLNRLSYVQFVSGAPNCTACPYHHCPRETLSFCVADPRWLCLLSHVFLPRCEGWARLSPDSMARAKITEPSRARAKTATVEELTRGAKELQEFLAQVEDLGREGFPYLDAARARTELQFRECIRRTFGERSPEFQEHRHHRLLMDTPEETRQSIALIKTLIATLEQKKLNLQGSPPPQQVLAAPLAPPMPTRPQMTLVPASISTVQMTTTQTGPIASPPVATNLGLAPVTAIPNPPQPPLAPSDSSRQAEPLSPSIARPEASPISSAPIATAVPHTPLQPVDLGAQEPQPPPAQAAQTAQVEVSHVVRPQQPLQPEPEPIVHSIPSASQEPKIQEAPPVPLHPPPQLPIPGSSSSSPQEAASQLAQNGSTPVELVKMLCHRFHSVARQLRLRGEYRATLSVEDEIDVQDLLHALLRIQFNDIDTEEWTPSYAEGATRTTFLLNDNQLAVLVKKTRNGLTAKDLTEQLRIDTERYLTKSRCTSLLCFIYDPDGRIGNPRAFETALTTVNGSLTIGVLIAPK